MKKDGDLHIGAFEMKGLKTNYCMSITKAKVSRNDLVGFNM